MISPIIEDILQTKSVQDASGTCYKLSSNIDSHSGSLVYGLIRSNPNIKSTLEVGCAYGLSSLYICSALAGRDNAKHLIIDPFQSVEWHGVGISNLERAGFNFFELIERPSEYVLPELTEGQEGTFDLVFIDGWHTFDHTLTDFFYANRLIKTGGFIVLDDCIMPAVAKVVSYFKNYPCYQIENTLISGDSFLNLKPSIKRRFGFMLKKIIHPRLARYIIPKYFYDQYYERLLYPRIVVFRKTGGDFRNWDWYRVF